MRIDDVVRLRETVARQGFLAGEDADALLAVATAAIEWRDATQPRREGSYTSGDMKRTERAERALLRSLGGSDD